MQSRRCDDASLSQLICWSQVRVASSAQKAAAFEDGLEPHPANSATATPARARRMAANHTRLRLKRQNATAFGSGPFSPSPAERDGTVPALGQRMDPQPVRGLTFLVRLATAALLVFILSVARDVLVPIAIAFILAFVLTQPLKALVRWHVPRKLALAIVTLTALAIVSGFFVLLAVQIDELAEKVSGYSESMRKRVVALQVSSGPLSKLEATFDRVTGGMDRVGPQMETVRTVPALASPAARLKESIGPYLTLLAGVGIVFILTLFFLSHREDLRNRVIRLAGPRNVTLTTRTMDEGDHRISRYLVAQLMVNAGLGTMVAIGLYFIGVPYPVLWGAFAAILRFVPYLGSLAAALMPAALAFALFPSWWPVLMTMGLFVVLDLLTAYLVEPVLIGHRTGVTAIALLVSTLFWVWLWGPIGLVLSTPLTVSLAVLGRHHPSLNFLSVLLGDEDVLGPEVTYYQRLLAHDEDEANEIAQRLMPTLHPVGVMDQVMIPALLIAIRDRDRAQIDEDDIAFLTEAMRESTLPLRLEQPRPGHAQVVGISTGKESELLLQMVGAVLPKDAGGYEILSYATLDLNALGTRRPNAVVLAALPPRGATPARELCRTLKERFPGIHIIALRPDQTAAEAEKAAVRFRTAGADQVVASIAEVSAAVAALSPRSVETPELPTRLVPRALEG